jgi:hypothetical protein
MKHKSLRKQYSCQAFVIHVWDALDCKVGIKKSDWSPGWVLINYLTHRCGVGRDFSRKMDWLAYVASF